jgi:(4S)-4-hydroxy-5-phosphonooxypentane-2,3-dione isomerase
MESFVLIVEFQVKPECLERFNQAIAINAQASVAEEPGCTQFDVLHSVDDPNHIVLYEVYDSEAAFRDDHMKRRHTQTFLAQAKELVTKQTAYRLRRQFAPPAKQ